MRGGGAGGSRTGPPVTFISETANVWEVFTRSFKRRNSGLRSCVKVEVAVLVSPSPTVRMVPAVDVKQHF